MKKEVLVIEDDQDIVDLLSIHLEDLDCKVTASKSGAKGLDLALENSYNLIILDLMLPDLDGLEVCRRVRAQKIYTPILMLTAKSEDIDKVLGLETGADDYLTKPFNVREFISRVKAIFRRVEMLKEESHKSESQIRFKDLQIDVEMRKVLLDDRVISLTPKEFDLLVVLATNQGRSFSREELLNKVWGYEFLGYEHTVNSHINRLRSKIERDLNKPEFILTTWGIGYRFNDED
jgi:DNA-binding response OmpR family regulator